MDEYITRNNAISAVCFGCNQQFSNEPCEPSECTIRQSIMALPTADVVPKSEVDLYRRQVDELEDELASTYDKRENARAEVAREIFEEIEKAICNLEYKAKSKRKTVHLDEMTEVVNWVLHEIIPKRIAELKKKYTESCTDCGHFVGCEKANWIRGCEEHTERNK